MRVNPRFLRLLHQMTHQNKYTLKDKVRFLDGLRYGLGQVPDYAGLLPPEEGERPPGRVWNSGAGWKVTENQQ